MPIYGHAMIMLGLEILLVTDLEQNCKFAYLGSKLFQLVTLATNTSSHKIKIPKTLKFWPPSWIKKNISSGFAKIKTLCLYLDVFWWKKHFCFIQVYKNINRFWVMTIKSQGWRLHFFWNLLAPSFLNRF